MLVDILNHPVGYKKCQENDHHHDADEQDGGAVISPVHCDHAQFAFHFSNRPNLSAEECGIQIFKETGVGHGSDK